MSDTYTDNDLIALGADVAARDPNGLYVTGAMVLGLIGDLRSARAERNRTTEQLAAATARAETAEAAYHRLDSEQAAAGSYAGRAEAAEAELATQRQRHRDAYLIVMQERDDARNRLRAETGVARELLQRNVELGAGADAVEAERDDLRARLEEIGEPTPQYGLRYGRLEPQPIGDGEVAFYRAEGHVGLVVRDVRRTGWRSAVNVPHADLDRLAAEKGVKPVTSIDQLTAPKGERLSNEEFAKWTAAWECNAPCCRDAGDEEGGGDE